MPNTLKPERVINRAGKIVVILQDAAGDNFEMPLSVLAVSKFVTMLYEARGKVLKERLDKS